MNEDLKTAVKNWLEAIMPAVTEVMVEVLNPDVLNECAQEQAIHGPFAIDLEEFGAPITAIHCYVMVIENLILMAVKPVMSETEESSTELDFEFVFKVEDFSEMIQNEEHIASLIETIMKQAENELN